MARNGYAFSTSDVVCFNYFVQNPKDKQFLEEIKDNPGVEEESYEAATSARITHAGKAVIQALADIYRGREVSNRKAKETALAIIKLHTGARNRSEWIKWLKKPAKMITRRGG